MKSVGGLRRNSGCWLALVKAALILAILFLFRYEISLLWRLLLAAPKLLRDQPVANLPPADDLLFQVLFIAFNLAGALLFSLLVVYLIGGAVLPVRNAAERWEAMRLFTRFVAGRRTPLLRVREGQLLRESLLWQKVGGGAAIVDLSSAIVLERQTSTPLAPAAPVKPPTSAGQGRPIVRVGSPGLNFIRRNEKLRGVVSLRNQVRVNPGVLAYTSDGIEVKTNVVAVFSLGQPPQIIKVAYVGLPKPENLRVLNVDPKTRKIKSFSDELDEVDRQEIHRFATKYLSRHPSSAILEPLEQVCEHPPYPIDEKRIFAAVYSQARHATESKLDDWTSLPALVATEIFHDMIALYSYDSLYLPDDPSRFPLQTDFKPAFARKVRYQGVISYQFVHRRDGQLPAEGQRLDQSRFYISPVQDLRTPKVLRDRGIKVLHAGFSELVPTDPQIKQQRLENWRARWQKEADLIKADLDLEAVRIKNRARAEKQREMINRLSTILNTSAYPEEALTLRIFQALEDIAADPSTRQLLPIDTIQVMKSLRMWLLPAGEEPPPAQEGRLLPAADGSQPQDEANG